MVHVAGGVLLSPYNARELCKDRHVSSPAKDASYASPSPHDGMLCAETSPWRAGGSYKGESMRSLRDGHPRQVSHTYNALNQRRHLHAAAAAETVLITSLGVPSKSVIVTLVTYLGLRHAAWNWFQVTRFRGNPQDRLDTVGGFFFRCSSPKQRSVVNH
jgi:hypothetical protein